MPLHRGVRGSVLDSGVLHEISKTSIHVRHLLSDMRATRRTADDLEYLWNMKTVWLVQNQELENKYERRRQMMRRNGRTLEETKDTLLFVAEGWANVQRICKFGMRSRVKKRNVLGDTDYGVHMNRNYDILLRFMTFKNFQQATNIIVFKGILGRKNMVRARLRGDFSVLQPNPHFDCHLSDRKPSLKMDICDAVAHNFAYIYEFSEESHRPVAFPSQLMPVAVISLARTGNRIGRNPRLSTQSQKIISFASSSASSRRRRKKRLAKRKARKALSKEVQRRTYSQQHSAGRKSRDGSKGRSISHRESDGELVKKPAQKSRDRDQNSENDVRKWKSQTESFTEKYSSIHTDDAKRSSRSRSKSHGPYEKEILQDQTRSESRQSPSNSKNPEKTSCSVATPDKIYKAVIDREDKNQPMINENTDQGDIKDASTKRPHVNLFDAFEKSNEITKIGTDAKGMDIVSDKNNTFDTKCLPEVRNTDDMSGKRETIVVRVFNNSENGSDSEDDEHGAFTFETADSDSHSDEDSSDHLQNEVDPECTKLLARLKEVENEIQQEQQKLSNLENIPKVLDTILHTSTETYDSRSSTPTLDEPSFDSANGLGIIKNTWSGQVYMNKAIINDIDSSLKVRIKAEPMSPPSILSPSESYEEGLAKASEISHSNMISANTSFNPSIESVAQGSDSTGRYVLKAVTVDIDSTKSIYSSSNGMKMPVNLRTTDEVKDPRIQRTMKGGVKSTDLAVNEFSHILGRIKQEPPDDETYGSVNCMNVCKNSEQSSEKCPNTSKEVMAPSSVSCHKDEVEKTLEELDKAIKVIQNQCSSSVCNDNTDVKKHHKNIENREVIGSFRPRNMGFSSYLPEYSEGSDYSRTARVLSDVFSPSKMRKEPMSSDVYFGTNNSLRLSSFKDDGKIDTSNRTTVCDKSETDGGKASLRARSRSPSPLKRKMTSNHSPLSRKGRLSPERKKKRRSSRVLSRGRSGSLSPRKRLQSSSCSSGYRSPSIQKRSLSRSSRSPRRRRRSWSSSSGSSRSPSRRRRSSGYLRRSSRRRRRSSSYSRRRPYSRKRSLSFSPRRRKRSPSYTSRSPRRRRRSSSYSSSSPHKRRTASLSPLSGNRHYLPISKRERLDTSTHRRRSPDTYANTQDQRILDPMAYYEAINKYNPDPNTTLHFENNILTRTTVAKPPVSHETKIYPALNPPPFDSTDKNYFNYFGTYHEASALMEERSRSPLNWPTDERCDSLITPTVYASQNISISSPSSLPSTVNEVNDKKRPGLLGDKPGEYILKPAVPEPSTQKEKEKEKEKEVDNTLSKAMASLLKKIMSNEKDDEMDTSTEGRMADMVIEVMKKQLQKEEKTSGKDNQTQNTQNMPYIENAQCLPQLPNMPCFPGMQQCMDPSQVMPYWPYQAFQYMQGSYMNGGSMWGYPSHQQMPMCTDGQFAPFIKKEKHPKEFGGQSHSNMSFGMNPQCQGMLQNQFQNMPQNAPPGSFNQATNGDSNSGYNAPSEKRKDSNSPFPFNSSITSGKPFDKNVRGGFMSQISRGGHNSSPVSKSDSSTKYNKSKTYYSTGFDKQTNKISSVSSGQQLSDKTSSDKKEENV